MKLALSALVSALCWSCRLVAAADTHVYTLDVEQTRDTKLPSALSPVEARLVLAQRSGVEDFHAADLDDAQSVQAINAFGRRTGLFGQRTVENMLVLVEAMDTRLPSLEDKPRFTISPAPSNNATHGLFLDLARQALPLHLNDLPDHEVTALLKGSAVQRSEHDVRRVAIWSESELQAYLEDTLASPMKNDLSVTIVTTPLNHDKDSKLGDFGTYSMPSSPSRSLLRKRLEPQESPLEEEPSSAPTSQSDRPLSSLASSSDPLPGILPACFTSLSACESTTRNCSGHGSCSKKYTDPTADDETPFKNCYACQCSATTQDVGNGRVKTTYWGGPACQKKDISVQFWLIALFSVAMVGLVSFAVGTVWSMGDEELPSVIGAGVSGPVKRN